MTLPMFIQDAGVARLCTRDLFGDGLPLLHDLAYVHSGCGSGQSLQT